MTDNITNKQGVSVSKERLESLAKANNIPVLDIYEMWVENDVKLSPIDFPHWTECLTKEWADRWKESIAKVFPELGEEKPK